MRYYKKITIMMIVLLACVCMVFAFYLVSNAKLTAYADSTVGEYSAVLKIAPTEPTDFPCRHSWSAYHPMHDKTCMDKVNAVRFCSICGEEEYAYNSEYGHNIVTVTEPATCSSKGKVSTKCDICGQKEQLVATLPQLEHSFVEDVVKPSCMQSGYTFKHCKNCSLEIRTNVIEPLGHDFSYKRSDDRLYQWIIDNSTPSGLFFRTCARENCDCEYNSFNTVWNILQAWYQDHNYKVGEDFLSPVDCIFYSHHDHDVVTDIFVSPTCVSEGYLQEHCACEFCEDCFDSGEYNANGEFKRAKVLRKQNAHIFVFGSETETCEHGAYNYLECNGCHQRIIITREDQGNVLFVGNGNTSSSTSGSATGTQSISPVGEFGCDTPSSLSYVAYVIQRDIKTSWGNVVFDEQGNPVITEHVSVVVYCYEKNGKDIQAKEHTVYNADNGTVTKGDESLKDLLIRLAEEFKVQREESEKEDADKLYTEVIPVVLSDKDMALLKSTTRDSAIQSIASREDGGVGGFGEYGSHVYDYKPVFVIKRGDITISEEVDNGDKNRPEKVDFAPILTYLLRFESLSNEIYLKWKNGTLEDDSIVATVEFDYNGKYAVLSYNDKNEIVFTQYDYSEDGTPDFETKTTEVIPPCMYNVKTDSVCFVCDEEVRFEKLGEHTEELYTDEYLRNPNNGNKLMVYRRHYCSCGTYLGDEWLTSQGAMICSALQEILDKYYIYIFGIIEGLIMIVGVMKGVEYALAKNENGAKKTREAIGRLIVGIFIITAIFAVGGKLPLLIMTILKLG